MEHQLAFLHTAAVHRDGFDSLCREMAPELRVRHVIDETLLADARKDGLTSALARQVRDAIFAAASTGARVVVCTCSTIGGLAECIDTEERFEVTRIDRAMADRAVRLGSRVLVMAALASTLEPTRMLLQASARTARLPMTLKEVVVDRAWFEFERGNHEGYLATIAAAIHENLEGVDVVVLAQASMAPVADRFAGAAAPVLSSPRPGMEAAISLTRSALQAGWQ